MDGPKLSSGGEKLPTLAAKHLLPLGESARGGFLSGPFFEVLNVPIYKRSFTRFTRPKNGFILVFGDGTLY